METTIENAIRSVARCCRAEIIEATDGKPLSEHDKLITEILDRLEVAEKEANKINGRMVEVKKRLQLIVEEPSNTMSNAKAMREMLRQANLALNALK